MGESNATANLGLEKFTSFTIYSMLRNHQSQQWERITRGKNGQRSGTKRKWRHEVTRYNQVKDIPKQTQRTKRKPSYLKDYVLTERETLH